MLDPEPALVISLSGTEVARGHDFEERTVGAETLNGSQRIPATRTTLARYKANSDGARQKQRCVCTVDTLGQLVRRAVQRLSADLAGRTEFSSEEVVQIAHVGARFPALCSARVPRAPDADRRHG